MKGWMKALMWALLGGGIGFFGGYQLGQNRAEKDCSIDADKDKIIYEQQNMIERAIKTGEKYAKIVENYENYFKRKEESDRLREEARLVYAGEMSTDDDPDMPEELPVIGDEDVIEESPETENIGVREIISEEEFYNNPGDIPQEELIWYSEDEVLWNKTTQSVTNHEEEVKAIGETVLNSLKTLNLDSVFVRNNMLPCMFRIDRYDAAFADERGDTSEAIDEDDE